HATDGIGRRPGALLITDQTSGALLGIFTDGDLRRLVANNPGDLARPIGDVMTPAPRTLPETALARDAVLLARQHRADEIPVVDRDGKPIGLLDVQDLVAMKLVQGD
ncbi:MAG: CBS domain-containing protein, partial [Planctomycetota bacterium]